MKILRLLCLILIHLLVVFLALNVLFSGTLGLSADPVLSWIPDKLRPSGPWVRKFYWAAALLLPVLYWICSFVIWKGSPRALTVKSRDGGTMLIHPGALQTFVRIQLENHPAVVSHKIDVRQSGSKGISVTAMVNVEPIASLYEIKS